MKHKLCLTLVTLALPFAAALGAAAHYSLGLPGAPAMRVTTNASQNDWLSTNSAYAAMSVVAPASNAVAVSSITVAGAPQVKLAAAEAGFALERTKPEYFLGDRIVPPGGVNWPATYALFTTNTNSHAGFLFDPAGEAVYVASGGMLSFTWVLTNGTNVPMTYVTASSCKGRPRRIYWTDAPYNAPGVNLSGKFVKFFGSRDILVPSYSSPTTPGGVTNIIKGLYVDPNTHMLNAVGEVQGQVVMAYYDTGTYENLLHVQAVEVCRPQVNVLSGEIGRALKPDGRGYDTSGLRARPTIVNVSDDRGDYLYQHKGQYSYSPKNGNVYPLRPTTDCRWNAEVYWMETDEMEVQWPFELDHYECDWPKDATVFVRGDVNEDGGRPIYVPSDYAPALMSYQEPEGHARAPTADGTFTTLDEGYSLLRLTTEDNIWFVPIRSVLRSNAAFFTLEAADVAVGSELRMREGALAGTAAGFSPACDPDSPGSIYETTSARIWNPKLYLPAQPDTGSPGTVDSTALTESGGDTNVYESVIYAVTANAEAPRIEVWWNTTIQAEDMPSPITIPTLPQVYSVYWPKSWEAPQVVIASQLGSAGESYFSHNGALSLDAGDSAAQLSSRTYFSAGGTVTFWVRAGAQFDGAGEASLLTMQGGSRSLTLDLRKSGAATNLVVVLNGQTSASIPLPADDLGEAYGGWFPVAVAIRPGAATVYAGRSGEGTEIVGDLSSFLGASVDAVIGAVSTGNSPLGARVGVAVGEVTFWALPLEYHSSGTDIATVSLRPVIVGVNGLSGLYSFCDGDLVEESSSGSMFTEKMLGVECFAKNCSWVGKGPPLLDTAVFDADADFTPRAYVQNEPGKDGYNPNEEHGFVRAGSGGYVAWALRADLNRANSSEPGVLAEYVKNGRKAMKWFGVAITNSVYPELAADCVAGKALPGPHPLDFFDDPWCKETTWDEQYASAPVHRDRKQQIWARAAGNVTMRMHYPMQEGFAFPSIPSGSWPQVGQPVPWLAQLGNPNLDPLTSQPAAWRWRISWPENVPELEIGRTLSVAASGLPEVWNAKSMGVVWPATNAERTVVLFDPTVAQSSGFTNYASVAEAVATLGIKQGKGGNATLRKGKWTFNGLPPSIAARFYLDTTADVTNCLKLVGQMEDNAGGVSLLHVNVLNEEERNVLKHLLDDTADNDGRLAWEAAISGLATARVEPSRHQVVSTTEDCIDYQPRDHYALFSMGETNYVTLIENDSTNALMNVSPGDPIQMRVIKVVPRYYVGRVVTREDPYNLLSQQLSVIYAEAFAGSPEDYVFEWKKCSPRADGVVPTDFEGEYTARFSPTNGLTRFVIGGQGDTLANMVNTYYAMRYRAADTNSPAYAAMGDRWSAWTDPPALAEGWVQRVLNNVTPFTQRMRDLVENEAETAVSMIRQAGAPYEGDVALSQENLTQVGLIQLYETLLSKAESMSLQLRINDAGANKQLQLAVARLGDLYNLLGDEAYTDALNPTIGFGPGSGLGSSIDYGALSSSLFCFDNQVPTLLDEELALLRGRTQENAPSTHLSPYYNRLVWNFTRGMNAGEMAYAMNYDISGNGKGVIDYSQAAEMYPQGHGDAYGHYLSALSGYYRLLRNPYFSWGKPAMGEMVVADAVLNVDYYDEAQFAKTAYNVAKTALEVVDRTARKAYRDNGGTSGAGYVDGNVARNFGYGEWASRGGFGALCNWAVGNSLLEEKPLADSYCRFAFTNVNDRIYAASAYFADIDANEYELASYWDWVAPRLVAHDEWTIEFQVIAGDAAAPAGNANLLTILSNYNNCPGFSVSLDATNGITVTTAPVREAYTPYWLYEIEYYADIQEGDEGGDPPDPASMFSMVKMRGEGMEAVLRFNGPNPPRSFPSGFVVTDALGWTEGRNIPRFDGWTPNLPDDLNDIAYYYPKQGWELDLSDSEHPPESVCVGQIPSGEPLLVALRSSWGMPVLTVFDASGAKLIDEELPFDFDVYLMCMSLGGGFIGEIGEFRVWNGVCRSDEELLASREYASTIAEGLTAYLRTISKDNTATLLSDEINKDGTHVWAVEGGKWIDPTVSGINIAFTDEGLKRIDRSTVPELVSLAGVAEQIQKKVDLMDAGMNPLGLSSAAIPFDITPIGMDDGTATHFEQIRARAGTALANARAALDKAQESASRMRMLQDAAVDRDASLESEELAFKNRMIEYFGYPYAGDIGPSGTYPQGYDGPDIYHYAWMDPADFGVDAVENKIIAELTLRQPPMIGSVFVPFMPASLRATDETVEFTFELSANGMICKPETISGKRLAQGKIQDALANFIVAYAAFNDAVDGYDDALEDYRTAIVHSMLFTTIQETRHAYEIASSVIDYKDAAEKVTLQIMINTLEMARGKTESILEQIKQGIPSITGAGMTVNTDPRALASIPLNQAGEVLENALLGKLFFAKNMLAKNEAEQDWKDITLASYTALEDAVNDRLEEFDSLCEAYGALDEAYGTVVSTYRDLQIAQAAVETVIAEAQRVIDERTLVRQQAVDSFTQARYGEMFFRIQRDNALSRYSTMFDLAQKYVCLAAQAYDYETGLLSSDSASGENFISRVVGARTLGEFDGDGNPIAATGAVKGDGGLADILAEMDANWLVLKPRLGINNPQPYATWFSLRHDLFRIFDGADGDAAWKTELRKHLVDDLNAVPEFRRYCQPLAGSTAAKEAGLVIPFSSEIAYGYNFFGKPLTSGDSALDPTYYATHIASAGVHFENYDRKVFANTPVAYLVPVGEDRMRAVGDPDTVLSWKVVDQTIPAPFAIGSTRLDDPDWTPLLTGNTGGNDVGARIRKHPSFRAYYGAKDEEPGNDSLDCTRLIGRSAWNTKWLLIIPAGSMNADREAALAAFIGGVDQNRDGKPEYEGVSDIKIGLRTYSASGN